ncbi:MAG: ribonuclease HII, partial [Candidatus Dormiibacterota bacterium]
SPPGLPCGCGRRIVERMTTRRRRPLLWASERRAFAMGYTVPAGIDEVGLGPLAGPAVAGAVVLPIGVRLPGLDDSKKLTALQRERLAALIRRRALAWAVHEVPPATIDAAGLTRARELAMEGAVRALQVAADYLLIDAWDVPALPLPQMCVVKGDGTSASIMAASIVAKVHRDGLMVAYDKLYPGYGFAVHKGYATAAHRRALRELGPTPIHRHSWAPVRAAQALLNRA